MKPLRVVRNLEKSPFRARLGQFEFVFSSDFNRRRFWHYFPIEKARFSDRFSKLYGIRVAYNAVTAFALYPRIERRGYLVRRYAVGVCESFYNPECVEAVVDIRYLPREG